MSEITPRREEKPPDVGGVGGARVHEMDVAVGGSGQEGVLPSHGESGANLTHALWKFWRWPSSCFLLQWARAARARPNAIRPPFEPVP